MQLFCVSNHSNFTPVSYRSVTIYVAS